MSLSAYMPARAFTGVSVSVPVAVIERLGAVIRPAGIQDAPGLHELITANLERGRLLPRRLEELTRRAAGFLVATINGQLAGCAELAPLSEGLAEIRSLVVDESYCGTGLGRRIVDGLVRRARADGFCKVCAFTHDPAPFLRMGFSIVPHVWLPEKIATNCCTCPLFRQCGKYAMLRRVG